MNCELFDDLLDEYVDRARPADDRSDERLTAFERHLAECARCQAVIADLTSIRLAASTLDEHIPPPRLWAKIASSIDEQQRQPWWQRQFGTASSGWVAAAVAASVAVLLLAGAWNVWRQTPAETTQQSSTPSSAPEPVPAEQHYEQAIAGLQQLADAQNAALDPATRAVLTRNLAVIDRAINESRAALTEEPASTLAQESLLDALETKVALLQDTVALASDIGGAADDAANAAKDLN